MKPAWLIGNVANGIRNLLLSLEMIASESALDPALTAKFTAFVAAGPAPSPGVPAPTAPVRGLGNAMASLYTILPDLVSGRTGIDPSLAPALLAIARSIGLAMAPADAAAAFAAAVDATPDGEAAPTQAPNRLVDAANGVIVARLTRIVLMAPYAEAVVRRPYASRQEGITARADAIERFERELGLCQGAPDADVAEALIGLRDRVVDYLSRRIATLAPVDTVSADAALPSLFWAWRLYGDPARAPELVSRNDVAHPSFMPMVFEALAP